MSEAAALSSPGVEEMVPMDPILPPVLPKTPKQKWKRSQKQKSRQVRRNEQKAKSIDGGARKVRGIVKSAGANANDRTCLADAIAVLPPDTKEEAYAAMIKAMPVEGDTSRGARGPRPVPGAGK